MEGKGLGQMAQILSLGTIVEFPEVIYFEDRIEVPPLSLLTLKITEFVL